MDMDTYGFLAHWIIYIKYIQYTIDEITTIVHTCSQLSLFVVLFFFFIQQLHARAYRMTCHSLITADSRLESICCVVSINRLWSLSVLLMWQNIFAEYNVKINIFLLYELMNNECSKYKYWTNKKKNRRAKCTHNYANENCVCFCSL